MMSKRKKNEGGFTLIELIMVIVILGIISAVAIPKFLSLSDAAKLSAARGVGSAISGTISSSHSDYLMNDNEYLLADVLSGTAFAGGITQVVGAPANDGEIGPSGSTIVLNYSNEVFIWDYTTLNLGNGSPAFLEEDASNFPTP